MEKKSGMPWADDGHRDRTRKPWSDPATHKRQRLRTEPFESVPEWFAEEQNRLIRSHRDGGVRLREYLLAMTCKSSELLEGSSVSGDDDRWGQLSGHVYNYLDYLTVNAQCIAFP